MKLLALAPAEQLIESLRRQRANLTAVGLYESANEATSAESFEHEDEHDVLGTSCRPKSWKKDSQNPEPKPHYEQDPRAPQADRTALSGTSRRHEQVLDGFPEQKALPKHRQSI